ncbi:sugar-binding transcriptional regulator [Propionicimonas sp.]|uniref:sugar-binding transcriptional regulator n=1 Tax=Propionicimonas sp. TaxID=1955623 RepID=UPI0017CFB0A4|nr:sugar-binding domain-containing protein [Propionicimonas sp.]MBU3976361.1 transcriptional regulator [Actinomycetota bacterium]MBA3022046.1 transcriptional regulator [Propionicimonas sp.]MBU3987518.1 transcriptional regulator [Actinomycetota bacterium]MBU4006537.1 transcriptional regulator [Actinomycetota bacterium]MBU4065142.1 transcriptional regulator [Actinomycetota bacterium]
MNDRYEEMYQAASRYYIQGETMESIARQLKLSRSSVSRLLKDARDSGLVRISLADHQGSASPMAATLAQIFGVRVHMVSVRENANEAARFEQVARLAGKLLTEMVDDHQLIGVAWGVTLSHIVKHLGRRPLVDATVVQINGGANQRGSGIPYIGEILQAFGEAFDARVVLFPVPAFFDFAATKDAMWRERSVRNVLRLHDNLDLAVFGVGCLQGRVPSHVYTAGYLDETDMAHLSADGVVGDVCTVLLREDGTYADIPHNARATGLTPAELQRINRRICVVADPSRAAAVVGALRSGAATDLVLDEGTARAVLDRLRV